MNWDDPRWKHIDIGQEARDKIRDDYLMTLKRVEEERLHQIYVAKKRKEEAVVAARKTKAKMRYLARKEKLREAQESEYINLVKSGVLVPVLENPIEHSFWSHVRARFGWRLPA